ncbi:hypothetical protein NC981_04180 [Leptolyngbya sp. DQ-M1]|uniref:hypothetical protein n=1 Tax=Leptolyngbya sp. DQ-M1 TaxID=2933920 RepID=UPI003298393A
MIITWQAFFVLKADAAPMCAGHALENWAILRTVALNVFRLHSFASITQGVWGATRRSKRNRDLYQTHIELDTVLLNEKLSN